jgi:hypothetical protein
MPGTVIPVGDGVHRRAPRALARATYSFRPQELDDLGDLEAREHASLSFLEALA